MFKSVSSCGILRFAPWKLTEVLHGAKAQASWAFISFDFSLVGLHLLSFWPCGPSFPFILALWRPASGPPPQVSKNGPLSQYPIERLYRRQARPHFAIFGLLGLDFLSFLPFGP